MDHTQKLVSLLLLDNHQGTRARTVLFEKMKTELVEKVSKVAHLEAALVLHLSTEQDPGQVGQLSARVRHLHLHKDGYTRPNFCKDPIEVHSMVERKTHPETSLSTYT